jgi:hypothetical protein
VTPRFFEEIAINQLTFADAENIDTRKTQPVRGINLPVLQFKMAV